MSDLEPAPEPQAPAPPQSTKIVDQGKPIPFKQIPDEILATVVGDGPPPTTLRDCLKANGHGGPKGNRWYYQHYPLEPAIGKLVGDVKVCEICGSVDI